MKIKDNHAIHNFRLPHFKSRILSLIFIFSVQTVAYLAIATPYTTQLTQAKRLTLKEAFRQIERESGYVFIYQKEIEKQLQQNVNFNSDEKSINKILISIFEDTNLTYQINDKQIIVKRKATKSSASPVQTDSQPSKTRKIKGAVSDASGEPLIGVSVRQSGSTQGTITDFEGNYSLEIPEIGETILIFSYIGMTPQEIKVSAKTNSFDVRLKEDEQVMDELVVVAYGVKKKGTIAGSVSTVKSEALENVPTAGFDQALQGQSAGLTVLSNSGEPSKAAVFQIRGTNSINSGTSPLFILDGVLISSSDFNTISPSDIESISVLKDASSTSIYGARAANGVVVITTKRGAGLDMLMLVPKSYADKGEGFRWDNIGTMINQGIEFSANADIIRTKHFNWNISGNASYNNNKITELYNGLNEYEISSTATKLVVGHALGEFYINRYAGVNPATGDALWYTKTGEITNQYNENDKIMIGKNYIAPWQGGFGTTASWNNFSLSTQFSWVANRWMFNNDRFFDSIRRSTNRSAYFMTVGKSRVI